MTSMSFMASSPVIYIVTSASTDWPAIVSAIATFAAAAIGIGGTAWQAKRGREAAATDLRVTLDSTTNNLLVGIAADADKTIRADKQRVYAACLAAVNNMIPVVAHYRLAAQRSEKTESREIYDRLVSIRTTLQNTIAELEITAPEEIASLAGDVLSYFNDLMATAKDEKLPSAEKGIGSVARLKNKMRADLGTPDS